MALGQNTNQPRGKMNTGGFQMPPEPTSIATDPNLQDNQKPVYPAIPMTPRMINSIKQAPKGKIPAGLARYIAAKKAAKAKGGK